MLGALGLAVKSGVMGPSWLGLVVKTLPKPVCFCHFMWKEHVKVTWKTFFDQLRAETDSRDW